MNFKLLCELFWSFAKVGAFTFGGGYAMLPLLQREIVENKHWATEEELTEYFAIGQCTPGVISVNTATFIGKKYLGNIGGIVATLGVVFPSVVIIEIIAAFIQGFADIPAVSHAFAGIRICVVVLILNSVIKMFRKTVVNKFSACLFVSIFVLAVFTPATPPMLVILAGACGLIYGTAKAKTKKEDK